MVKKSLFFVFICILFSGCFRKNILFQTDSSTDEKLLFAVGQLEKTYIVKPNDYLDVQVYTNNGERLIDPNNAFAKQALTSPSSNTTTTLQPIVKYLVQPDGKVDLPMIGSVKVDNLSLHQVDSLLSVEYGKFYKEAYVYARLLNKRVLILGATGIVGGANSMGTSGKVIPLDNENMSLIEVITLAGGIDYYSKANNIRVIRGDLKNPSVQLVDLTTIEGMKKANLAVQPNDIIYIEKYNRRFSQSLQEVTPALSIFTSLLTIIVLIVTVNK